MRRPPTDPRRGTSIEQPGWFGELSSRGTAKSARPHQSAQSAVGGDTPSESAGKVVGLVFFIIIVAAIWFSTPK